MFEVRYVVVVLSLVMKIYCRMEGFIVGGEPADIGDFPYAAYVSVTCKNNKGYWSCGGGIINQDIIITAAHCIRACPNNEAVDKVSISVGSSNKNGGQTTQARKFICHEGFNEQDFSGYDIALVRTQKKLLFNKYTSRVAIMQKPPVVTKGQVAGWGYTDEVNLVSPVSLMKLAQVIWTKSECENLYGYLHPGSFCASSGDDNKYIAPGDSGSALVINGYIQIGIVSYKLPTVSKSVIIYTDVSYFYTWIQKNSIKIYCQ